jgi:predicted deacetylase
MNIGRQLTVSIHDVTPPHRERTERLLDVLASAGVARRSLLVIPNFRGTAPIDRDVSFCDWLRHRQQEGDEIVLHGYEHIAVGAPRTLLERLKNRWYTQDEGEFLALDYADASARIAKGVAMLGSADVHATGFVAPSWLINDDGLRAARDQGFQYTNSYFGVLDLANGRNHIVPTLVFGPGHLNEDVGIALQERATRFLALCPNARVVLHPPNADHQPRLSRIVRMIERLKHDRETATYAQLLERLRTSGTAGAHSHAH